MSPQRDHDVAGYIFGYGSLVVASDPLVTEVRTCVKPVRGTLAGFRRRWNLAMENRAPLNDDAHYLDAATGERPDIYVVALNLDEADHEVNGVAVPVPEWALEQFDERELHYDRIEVTERFSTDLDLPVWTYVADERARRDFATGQAERRAFISRSYYDKVVGAYRGLGEGDWAAFERSTDPPESPLRDLRHVRLAPA